MKTSTVAYLLELYEEQNISRASAKMFISQQGLSRQIQALEQELDVQLFERGKSGAVPTELCRQLYPQFCAIDSAHTAILEGVKEYKQSVAHPLTVAFANGLVHGLDTDFMFAFQKEHPERNIDIEEWPQPVCIQKLLTGRIALAFLVTPVDTALFNCVPLAEDYMYVAVHRSSPLAETDAPLEFSRLDGERIITGAPDNALRGIFDHYCAVTGISPRIIVSSSSSLSFVNAMHENTGVCTVTSTMAFQITNPEIVVRRLLPSEPGLLYCCTAKGEKPGRDLRELIDFITEHFEKYPLVHFKEN